MQVQVKIDEVELDFDGPMDKVSRRPSEAEQKRIYKRMKGKTFDIEVPDAGYVTVYDATCDFLEERFGWMVFYLEYSLVQTGQLA